MKQINSILLVVAAVLLAMLLGLYTYFSSSNASMNLELQANRVMHERDKAASVQIVQRANRLRPFLMEIVRRISDAPNSDTKVKALLEKYKITYNP